MEVGDKLKDLNMTVDEIDRLTKAFKEEKFKEMLRDYAEELSDPENRRRYEEEIQLLEQERGNKIEFIHPQPFRALRTSVNGKQKCFINICANEKIGKPAFTWGVSEEGRRGQRWSLPHSLHPGRHDTDPKGNKIMIYDVIFHPDTLHIASKNERFMDMVDSTAIQGIQNAFKVTLDKNNVREMSTKYKGTPQPCVTRKPIPGCKARVPSEKPDPLAFPYPDDKGPATFSQTKPTDSPATKSSSDAEPESFQVQPRKTEPTKPNYAVKYRSFIDLQDFRCSRDSAQSPRPKEIVVTIDMPLLKAVTDTSLEVKERRLLLESKKPAYRLDLPLAYPVDEDKGEARFNKQRGQLTVTLPVLPSNEAFDFAVGPAWSSVSDDERQEEKSEVEEDTWKKERAGLRSEAEEQRDVGQEKANKGREIEEEDLKQQPSVEKGAEEKGEEQMKEGKNGEEAEIGVEEAKWKKQRRKCQESAEVEKLREQKQENEKEVGKLNLQKSQQNEDILTSKPKLREDESDRAAEKKDFGGTNLLCNTADQCTEVYAAEGNLCVAARETENHPSCIGKEGEVTQGLAPKMKTSDIREETEKTKETLDGNPKVETHAAFLHHGSNEAASSIPADPPSRNVKDRCISRRTEESSEMPAIDEVNKSSRGGSDNRVTLRSEELATGSVKREERENIDEDDLLIEQIFQSPEHDNKPPPVLREIDEDGNEIVISDHSTSAGFIFQNSLMYELD